MLEEILDNIPSRKLASGIAYLIPRRIAIYRNIMRENKKFSEQFLKKIQQDKNFYHELI